MVGGREKVGAEDLLDATVTLGWDELRGALYARPEACTSRGGCGPCVSAVLFPRATVTLG